MRARGRQELRQPSYLRPYRMCRVCRTSDGDWTRSVSFDGSRGIGKSRISKGREDDRRATRQITNCKREEEEGRKEAKERKTHREREREREEIGTKRGRVCERSSRQEQPRRQSERGGVNGR